MYRRGVFLLYHGFDGEKSIDTQKITNSNLYNLIEVTEQSPDTAGSTRNQSTVVAGAELGD
jgi:hypothetical protein